MADDFRHDVFLSHNSRDKAVVRDIARRLRADGLRVWLDEDEIKPGHHIQAKIEDGLEHSRVLVLCMSANAFGSDWAKLEAGTFRFRDPLNAERRFIPLRLDDAPIPGSLAQFLYISWLPPDREQGYPKLLEACRPPAKPPVADLSRPSPSAKSDLSDVALAKSEAQPAGEQVAEKAIQFPRSQRCSKTMKEPAMGWRESLAVIQRQFEARAEQSRGLHHLLVEVSDDERARMAGPDWFARLSRLNGANAAGAQIGNPWFCVSSSGLPMVSPGFRELAPGETLDGVPDDHIVRDGSGIPRALKVPMRLRQGYLCGDGTQLSSFESLARAASQVLTDGHELLSHSLAEDMYDLFRGPRGGVRYVFGDVPSQPTEFMASGWKAGVLVFEHGVVIDVPIAESVPGVEHWLLLLHRLSWRRHQGSPLSGARLAWHENTTVPYEWVSRQDIDQQLPTVWQKRFAQISGKSYYSILGERDRPLDVNLASVFAIQLLLSAEDSRKDGTAGTNEQMVDYSREAWHQRRLPEFDAATAEVCHTTVDPRVLLLTATSIERDAVLKQMQPAENCGRILRVYHENNTFFVGRLGVYAIVLCMCEVGSTGRDSALTVTTESIQLWKPSAVVMAGIAFGRDRERQKLGDVLIADRVIPYEPSRVGVDRTIPRGHELPVSPLLLNRFRNALGWSFLAPSGVPCDLHFGAVLSGEKLVDNPRFKQSLSEGFPDAIGGEMEGAGLAAAAERSRCHWILAKGICDWGDGTKSKRHQGFAAAAAVSLVQHVLSQAGAIPT